MEKKMTILYDVGKNIYVNVTNRCPCSCTFCIRNEQDKVYGSDVLWLEHEPSFEEVVAEFEKKDLSQYKEVVFCGYGEPTERFDFVMEICDYIKSKSDIAIRINTNGLANLIHDCDKTPLLKGRVDILSISLNAPTSEEYMEVSRPKFGEKSFPAILDFAKKAKEFVPKVMFSVVDCIGEEKVARSQALADEVGIKLRVRKFE